MTGTDSISDGVGERDVLSSSSTLDEDLFVLGDASTTYYLDSGASSTQSFARITDFDILGALADQIQLEGSASNYRLNTVTVIGQSGVGIYRREGTSSPGDDDLIGLIQGSGVNTSSLNLNNGNQFVYV